MQRKYVFALWLLVFLPLVSHASPSPVTVSVNWSHPVAHAGPLAYGLNGFAGFDPVNADDAAYNANIAYMHPGFVRLHNQGMVEDVTHNPSGWVDEAHRSWDAAKIRRDLAALYPSHPVLMLTIPTWPSWMSHNPGGFLDDDQQDAYAQFCADLVRIVNKDIGRHVMYWEVTNEQDGRYYKDFHADNGNGPLNNPSQPDRVEELAAIFRRCAIAMKQIDPTILVGGPAAENPWNLDFDRRFVQAALPQLDFFSYHAYASGSKDDSDTAIFRAPDGWANLTRSIVAMLHTQSPHRRIPTFFDEYNISWTWETQDPRMTNNKGAVFDALVVASVLTAGADATAGWNDKDGIYGKTDLSDHRRPGADALHLFNQYLFGEIVASSSSDSASVVVYAVHASRAKTIMLINRSSDKCTVTLQMQGQSRTGSTWYLHQLSDVGPPRAGAAQFNAAGPANLWLPPDSVTLLTTAAL